MHVIEFSLTIASCCTVQVTHSFHWFCFNIINRVTDAAFQFLLVWYYCTLTIREHILKVNGSRLVLSVLQIHENAGQRVLKILASLEI